VKPWKVVAYHTDDALYNEQMLKLIESLVVFGIDYSITRIPYLGGHRATVQQIPKLIKEELNSNNNNLVYLDCDAVVRQYPALFDSIEEDFAVHYKDGKELLMGTMYFKNCSKTKLLIDNWIIYEDKIKEKLSAQTSIPEAIIVSGVSVNILPAPYTLIFDSMKEQGPPVIEHFQASRKAIHNNDR